MQRTCINCLSRQKVASGSRSYGVVPKPTKPKAQPISGPGESTPRLARRSPVRLAGYLADGGVSSDTAVKPAGSSRTSTRTSFKGRPGRPDSHPTRLNGNADDHFVSSHKQSRRPPSRPSTPQDDLDAPSFPSNSHPSTPNTSRFHFKGLHHETAIPAFHRPSNSSTPIIKYRDTYLHLRATPSHLLPPPPASPFPAELPTYKNRHPRREVIDFGVVASKNSVSPVAVERGRVRKRFKAVVEEILNGNNTVRNELRRDWSYLAVLNREVYEADMKDLCASLTAGLTFIKRQQDRGIGTGSTAGGVQRRSSNHSIRIIPRHSDT